MEHVDPQQYRPRIRTRRNSSRVLEPGVRGFREEERWLPLYATESRRLTPLTRWEVLDLQSHAAQPAFRLLCHASQETTNAFACALVTHTLNAIHTHMPHLAHTVLALLLLLFKKKHIGLEVG